MQNIQSYVYVVSTFGSKTSVTVVVSCLVYSSMISRSFCENRSVCWFGGLRSSRLFFNSLKSFVFCCILLFSFVLSSVFRVKKTLVYWARCTHRFSCCGRAQVSLSRAFCRSRLQYVVVTEPDPVAAFQEAHQLQAQAVAHDQVWLVSRDIFRYQPLLREGDGDGDGGDCLFFAAASPLLQQYIGPPLISKNQKTNSEGSASLLLRE